MLRRRCRSAIPRRLLGQLFSGFSYEELVHMIPNSLAQPSMHCPNCEAQLIGELYARQRSKALLHRVQQPV